ncbi:MAG: hypothetical protein Q4D07_03415 [Selenomonadaceae bacterium]|nr:hypothetical protein [Selenomonadaceae bacterium]
MKLSSKMVEFIQKEFGVEKNALEKFSKEQWRELRDKSIRVVVDELLDDNGDMNEEGAFTERHLLAQTLCETTYSEAF